MDQRAYNYLERVDPKMWSCHAFRMSNCSGILLNNIAESFNTWVLKARDKRILTCLETTRRLLMNRFDKKKARAANATNLICPKIVKKLERNKKEANDYICHWSDNFQFEIDRSHEPRRIIDLKAKTCGCGWWQLNGFPWGYAICAIYRNRWYAKEYISKWYLMDIYKLSYAPSIHPMLGPSDWPIDRDIDPIEPPMPNPRCGRPKELRKRGIDETEPDESVRVTRKGYGVCCGNCGQKGHNARSCSQPENPNRKKYPKRVRKSKPTNVNCYFFFF
jgi:hypothetical protein